LQSLRFTIQEHNYYLINVYGYNHDDTSLPNTINTIILENFDKTFIIEITNINKYANPNTLWEIIKGTIRNTSIKYSYEKKNEHNALKHELSNNIDKLQKELENSRSNNNFNIVTDLSNAKQQMTEILEIELKGILIRSKAEYNEGAEKNTKYLANLEKKIAESNYFRFLRFPLAKTELNPPVCRFR